jgi:hypothetical protein
MTATVITVQDVLAPFSTSSGSAGAHDFTWAASSGSVTDAFTCSGRDLLLANNTDGGALTITIASVDDEKGRSEPITAYSMAAGDFAVFGVGLTNSKGWMDTSKKITVTTSGSNLKLAVLNLPSGYPQ